MRHLTLSLFLLFLPSLSFADEFVVSNNPYRNVNFSTTQRCMAQLHDHVKTVDRIAPYDAAGYCAITWMDYAGNYSTKCSATQVGLGNCTDEQIGQRLETRLGLFDPPATATGRPWPAEDNGATNPASLTSIDFYIPGMEDLGLTEANGSTAHGHSTFMTEYIEAAGCSSCGLDGAPVRPAATVPPENQYTDNRSLINLINAKGGFAIFNHPSLGTIGTDEPPIGWMGIEIVNTFMALRDDVSLSGISNRLSNARGYWDAALESRSARIWAVAVNDNYGPYKDLCGAAGQPACTSTQVPNPLLASDLDQGKIEVLLTSKDLTTFEAAFRQGAFFAVHENENAVTKGAYPQVTNITVTTSDITITTTAGTETITWIGNGSTISGANATINLRTLPAGTKYVRAEINDGAGRTLYTQPFELSSPASNGVGWFGRR